MIHAILYPTSALQLSTLPIPPLGSLLDSLRQTILESFYLLLIAIE